MMMMMMLVLGLKESFPTLASSEILGLGIGLSLEAKSLGWAFLTLV